MRFVTSLIAAGAITACSQMPEAAEPAPAPTVDMSDLARLEGAWTGALIYRDYSPPNEDITIPATLLVDREGEGLRLKLNFPDEPSAYDTSMLTPSADGRILNSENVVARQQAGECITLVTQSGCEDDGREAACEMTYVLSPDVFEMTKMVSVDGEPAFRRNAYAFERAGTPD
ncbi:hypothetical protein [Henriciella marina]|uniref:hypothetical protein n=1 Tax=Henriciella marina TaxID=453851 RepID=UPI0003750390|nr:hypothetical protein [Henriciella marina]